MPSTDDSGVRRISANLPLELIEGVDELKKEWGLRSRGAVLERLLEDLFNDSVVNNSLELNLNSSNTKEEDLNNNFSDYNENRAIVLIGNSDIEITEQYPELNNTNDKFIQTDKNNSSTGVDLPGFVQKKTKSLKNTLKRAKSKTIDFDSCLNTVKKIDIDNALKEAINHWNTLYGQKPGENVIEAAMIWLARDIWPHIEGSENTPFTWTYANKLMSQYCSGWVNQESNFQTVIVMAGVLEDPFAAENLNNRIPTIIRRFVNRFKRINKGTSFQTIESTMTVHGALKLLGLPTVAGSSLTLISIRDSYKQKALENHPDSGGSTEIMRKLNEAYQLLKDLYKNK